LNYENTDMTILKKSFLFLIVICLLVSFSSCGSKELAKRSDALKFKDEYELINGNEGKGDVPLRSVSISEDNPFVYSSYSEIGKMMDEGKSFIVYFGFSSCPWCRACIESFISCAKEKGIKEVYYVDVYFTRDIYEFVEDGKVEKTSEAEEGYYELLEKMDDILDEYVITSYADSSKSFDTGEKRIYAPNFIAVVDGKAVKLEESGDLMTDANAELTDDIISELLQRYNALLDLIK